MWLFGRLGFTREERPTTTRPMRTASAGLLAVVPTLLLFTSAARSEVQLPRPSPLARVMQTVGLTEIEVEYSSPAARGRQVFGGLVPYGEHWRTGANANTIIRFSKPVTIAGKKLPAGAYSLHTIPGKSIWVVIFNKKTDGGGSSTYDKKQDVLRVQVPALRAPNRERLLFLFTDTTDAGTNLDLEWAGVGVRIPIQVDTKAQVDEEIAKLGDKEWRPLAAAARYLLEQGRDFDRALSLVNRSIAIESTWLNLWTKARILAARGEVAPAVALTKQALEKGDESSAFKFYSGRMKAALRAWGAS